MNIRKRIQLPRNRVIRFSAEVRFHYGIGGSSRGTFWTRIQDCLNATPKPEPTTSQLDFYQCGTCGRRWETEAEFKAGPCGDGCEWSRTQTTSQPSGRDSFAEDWDSPADRIYDNIPPTVTQNSAQPSGSSPSRCCSGYWNGSKLIHRQECKFYGTLTEFPLAKE